MLWLEDRLYKKFAVGMAAGLLVSSLAFLILFVGLYRGQIERARSDAAKQVTSLLQSSLENAMLKRDLDGVKDIVDQLGAQPGILGVMIANPRGDVRYSNDPQRIGEWMPPDANPDGAPVTRFLDDARGALLRSINPVLNRAACRECHGSVEQNPVNGILYVDFDAQRLRGQARATTLLLMGAGALIVLINLAGGWWFIRRFVIRPIEHLSQISQKLSAGELGARTSLAGRDELAVLGERFNRMARSLQEKIEELQEKEQFMQQMIDAVPDGIRVIDPEYRVLLANSTYRQQVGGVQSSANTEFCYVSSHQREQPCPRALVTCPLVEIGKTGEPLRVVHRQKRADGSPLDVEIYAAPMEVMYQGKIHTYVVESIRDLGQQVRFSHEQKLSELGRLAAGVAHEIHNPLAAVRMALHAADQANRAQPPDPAQVSEYLGLVDQEVEKCNHVTERLLKLSIPAPEQTELVDVDRVLDETLRLLNWEGQTRSVEIRLNLEDGPLRILATDSDMRMVTLNLSQNAMHAMPDGGVLTVTGRRAGNRVEVCFSDDGVGVDRADRQRIFEPFFSRRADGVRGTGLGLSITKSIVEAYGGDISVESEPGQGTRVTVTFADADRDMEL